MPEVAPEDTIHEVKRLTGRMVAINLEPAAVRNDGEKSVWSLTEGRRATVENAKKAADKILKEGIAKLVLVGNEEAVKKSAAEGGFDISGAQIVDPATSEKTQGYIDKLVELRQKKGSILLLMRKTNM